MIDYTGDAGCQFYDIDISKFFKPFTNFIGAIEIILGLILCFAGSKFILIVFGLLIFMATQGLGFAIMYSSHLFNAETIETKKGTIIGVGCLIFAVGLVTAYYMSKFADKFAVPLISGWCGFILSFMIVGGIHAIPSLARLAIVGVLALAAAYYSFKVQRFIKSAGTGLIGSFLLFNGISKYAGGYPEIFEP